MDSRKGINPSQRRDWTKKTMIATEAGADQLGMPTSCVGNHVT